jgi:hypothetical protein
MMDWKTTYGSITVKRIDPLPIMTKSKYKLLLDKILIALKIRRKRSYFSHEELNEAINRAQKEMEKRLEEAYYANSPLFKKLEKRDAT